jgi:hypothetical protein
MFDSEWEKELKKVVDKLRFDGWEIFIDPYYIQGEETLTLQKNEKYLHFAYGDLDELKTLFEDINEP